jgi:hypothetical protein
MNAPTSPEQRCPHAEQAVGLALHALEPADEDLLANHVPRCAVCQEMIRQTQDVVWGLAAEAEQHEPPARLQSNLMAAVAATEQLPPELRERPWTVQPAEPAPRPGPAVDGRPRPADGAPAAADLARQARRRLIALVATFVVGVAGIGAVTYELVERARQQDQTSLAAPSPEVVQLLAEADRAGARHAVLHAPDGKVIAAVAQFPDNGRQVMPIELPANQVDHTTYVLWGLGSGSAKALGTFDVPAPSETMLPVRKPGTGENGEFAIYAISIENGRGIPLSPGLVVASGRVQS